MKKLISVFLCVLMLSAILAVPASAEEWPATTIQYININSESMGGQKVQAMIDRFNETNDKNITVEFNFISPNYPDIAAEVMSYLAAGQGVGVVQIGYAYINYFAGNFPQLQNVEEVVSKYFPEDEGFLEEYYSDAVLNLGLSVDGALVGIPFGMSTPVLFYNADLVREAGLDPDAPPTTWQEVAKWADEIIAKTGKKGVAIQNPNDTYSIIPVFLSSGMDSVIKNDNGAYSADLLTDDSVASWTLLQDMTKNGEHLQVSLDDAVGGFAGGEIAMMLTTSGRAAYFYNNCEFEVRDCMQPTFEGHDLKVCIGGNVMGIITDDEAQQKASWELIKFLLQPENIGIWCEATGYLPPTKNSADDPTLKAFLDGNPLMAAAVAERDYAGQWTSWPGKNGLQVDQYLVNMRDAIMANGEDVRTAIQTAQDTINDLLK